MLHRTPDKLPVTYLFFATLVTNTLVALFLVNGVLAGIYYVRDRRAPSDPETVSKPVLRSDTAFFYQDGSPVDNGKRSPYQMRWFDFNAYENIDAEYAAIVLEGFWGLGKLGFIYEPWVGFAEPPFNSKLVNVDTDAHGFPIRHTINPNNDLHLPIVSIFVMGGSPTFSYNVSDEHTWASHLSRILNKKAQAEGAGFNVQVVNYGKAFYYPSQETALLVDLLKSGQRPNLIIFLDGVNLGPSEDVPRFTMELTSQMTDMQFPASPTEQLSWIPIVRLANAFRRRLFNEGSESDSDSDRISQTKRVEHLVNMFDRNMEISRTVAKLYGAETLFVLQPNVAYHYSTRLFRRPVSSTFVEDQQLIEKLYQKLKLEQERVDLSELFGKWGVNRKAVVDDVHYSPSFSKFVAEEIAKHIDLKSLVPRTTLVDESAATGRPRPVYLQRNE
jgi:hypothetical protein